MNFAVTRRCLIALCLLAAAARGFAQERRNQPPKDAPAAHLKLIAVNVTGSRRYTAADVMAATGLQPGVEADEADFKAAARSLVESGVFSDVAFEYSYADAGTTVEWKLTDSAKQVPAEFDNFVWLSAGQLAEELRRRVPLFHGDLPLGGILPDEVSDALQLLLDERGVRGHVDYLRVSDRAEAITSYRYTVSGVPQLIRQFQFPGAGPEETPLLEKAAKKLVGDSYSESKVRVNATMDFLPVYRQRGYLKAEFGRPQAMLVDPKDPDVPVDVVLPVDPGHAYQLDQVRWSGSTVFPAEQLAPMLHLQLAKPANAVQLDSDLREVANLYGTRGYMTAQVKPLPQFNEEKQTVSYELRVQEGPVYHMGDLDLSGPDFRATEELKAAWTLHEGDTFDSSYPAHFLKTTANLLPTNLRWFPTVHTTLNEKDKSVDVSIRYSGRSN